MPRVRDNKPVVQLLSQARGVQVRGGSVAWHCPSGKDEVARRPTILTVLPECACVFSRTCCFPKDYGGSSSPGERGQPRLSREYSPSITRVARGGFRTLSTRTSTRLWFFPFLVRVWVIKLAAGSFRKGRENCDTRFEAGTVRASLGSRLIKRAGCAFEMKSSREIDDLPPLPLGNFARFELQKSL